MGNGDFRSSECIDLLKQLETKLKKNNVFFTSIRAKDLYFNNFKKLLKCSAIDRNTIINQYLLINIIKSHLWNKFPKLSIDYLLVKIL